MWMVKDILEADYGCEERQPGEGSKALVILENEAGEHRQQTVEEQWLARRRIDKGSTWIGTSNWLAPGAYVGGDVTLGEEIGIWYGAVVRGDSGPIVIGDRSNIQDNCTVHTDPGHRVILGADVSVGHNAVVHGCTIGDNSVIGMGSILLNGAVVGSSCIIGAGSLVTGKTRIPDGMLAFGNPARVVRPLTPEEISHNIENARHYVGLLRAQLV